MKNSTGNDRSKGPEPPQGRGRGWLIGLTGLMAIVAPIALRVSDAAIDAPPTPAAHAFGRVPVRAESLQGRPGQTGQPSPRPAATTPSPSSSAASTASPTAAAASPNPASTSSSAPSSDPTSTGTPVVATPTASEAATSTPTRTPGPTASPPPPGGSVHVYAGQNLQAKLDSAGRGTVFFLHAGTYQSFDMRAGLTVQAAGDGEVVVTGGTGSWDAGIWVKDAPNITIRGLTVRGNTLGIFLRNSPGALVESNFITDNAFGLEIHDNTTGTIIRNNKIHHNDRFLDPSRKAGGMNLMDTSGGITVVGNSIIGNDAVGIEIYGMDDAVITSNVIAGSADAIETGTRSGGDCKNNLIVRNIIYQTRTRPEERGIWLRCMSRSTVAHNVLDGMDKFGIGVVASGNFSGPVDNLRVMNNVVVNGRGFWLGTSLPSSVVIDYNNVRPCTSETTTCGAFGNQVAAVGSTVYDDLASFRASTPYMDHGLSVDPAFVNPAARDYRLGSGSRLIDAGAAIGFSYNGAAPDIGRFER